MRGSPGFVLTCMERRRRGDLQRGVLEGSAMWKAIVAGTAVLAIAGTSLVYAQQRGPRDGMMMQRSQLNAEDLRAFGEARLAALKAGLVLTPEQEKNWPAFEQAGRDDPVERMRQRATAMSDVGAALKKLADATDPLYKSLDENQKRRFAILNRLTGPDRGGFRSREGMMHHRWGSYDRGRSDMEHSGGQRL